MDQAYLMNILNLRYVKGSLKFKFTIIILATAFPLTALLVFQNFYSVTLLHDQVARSQQKVLSLYMNKIDMELDNLGSYIHGFLSSSLDLDFLEDSTPEDADYQLAKMRVANLFSNDIMLYHTAGGFFTYLSTQDELVYRYDNTRVCYEMKELPEIKATLQRPQCYPPGVWSIVLAGKRPILIRVVQTGNVYVGAWIDVKGLLSPDTGLMGYEEGEILFLDRDGRSYPESELIRKNRIRLESFSEPYAITGSPEKYLVVEEESQFGLFSLVALIPDRNILRQLPFIRGLNWGIIVIVLLILVFFYILQNRILLKPLFNLISAMDQLKDGDFSVRISMEKTSLEFNQLHETFNLMASRIKDLKIEVYEEKMELQKAELAFLRVQINPHFFLNSLNILYQLAEIGEKDLLQHMVMNLSKYFQFVFRSTSTVVLIEEELKHVETYLDIQKMRYPLRLSVSLERPVAIPQVSVPPLLLQTFIENSIMHGFLQDEDLEISINIREEGDDLSITIADTGCGFPETILKAFSDPKVSEGHDRYSHIGLENARRRLQLIYGERGCMKIRNRGKPEKGAIVHIRIPLSPAAFNADGARMLHLMNSNAVRVQDIVYTRVPGHPLHDKN